MSDLDTKIIQINNILQNCDNELAKHGIVDNISHIEWNLKSRVLRDLRQIHLGNKKHIMSQMDRKLRSEYNVKIASEERKYKIRVDNLLQKISAAKMTFNNVVDNLNECDERITRLIKNGDCKNIKLDIDGAGLSARSGYKKLYRSTLKKVSKIQTGDKTETPIKLFKYRSDKKCSASCVEKECILCRSYTCSETRNQIAVGAALVMSTYDEKLEYSDQIAELKNIFTVYKDVEPTPEVMKSLLDLEAWMSLVVSGVLLEVDAKYELERSSALVKILIHSVQNAHKDLANARVNHALDNLYDDTCYSDGDMIHFNDGESVLDYGTDESL